VAVVVALKGIGVVLVNAMLSVPAATAGLIVDRMSRIMAVGAAVALLSSVVGLHVSYYARVSASAAIVLTACLIFLAAALITARRAPLGVADAESPAP